MRTSQPSRAVERAELAARRLVAQRAAIDAEGPHPGRHRR